MGKWVDSWGADNELMPPEPDVFQLINKREHCLSPSVKRAWMCA